MKYNLVYLLTIYYLFEQVEAKMIISNEKLSPLVIIISAIIFLLILVYGCFVYSKIHF